MRFRFEPDWAESRETILPASIRQVAVWNLEKLNFYKLLNFNALERIAPPLWNPRDIV